MSDLGLTERRATPRGKREEVQDGNEIGAGSSIHPWCFTHLGILRQGVCGEARTRLRWPVLGTQR